MVRAYSGFYMVTRAPVVLPRRANANWQSFSKSAMSPCSEGKMQFVVPFLASTAQQRYALFVLYSNADIFFSLPKQGSVMANILKFLIPYNIHILRTPIFWRYRIIFAFHGEYYMTIKYSPLQSFFGYNIGYYIKNCISLPSLAGV